ncbi:MAG: hypothetical protein ACJ8AE_02220, partial [Gemmatimonadaceae bacterium]
MSPQSARSAAASRKRRTTRSGAAGVNGAGASRTEERARATVDASPVSPRRGAKRTIMSTMKELPNFLRLLG